MRIGIRAGHNKKEYGAVGLLDEYIESRRLLPIIISNLKQKHEVFNLTPDDNISNEFVPPVKSANALNLDLFISLHFNSYSSHSANGCETLVYSKSDSFYDESIALSINNNLSALGFNSRGVKERGDLYELQATKMKAIIVEVCFVSSPVDVNLYKTVGIEKISRAISLGIDNTLNISNSNNNNNNATTTPLPKPIDNDTELIISTTQKYGTFKVTEDKIFFRNNVGIDRANSITGNYLKGETVNYDKIIETNKYKYISWMSFSGIRRYMPVLDKSNNEVWGVFI